MVRPASEPEVVPIVAMAVLPESHEPPGVGSVSVVDMAGQTRGVPLIGDGNGLTVKSAVTKHPLPTV